MLLRAFSFCLLFATAAYADPGVSKAKTEEPVVEELMGGCSLKCAFDWTARITAPGARPENTGKIDDDSALTAWAADNPTTGVGVKLRMIFPKARKNEETETPLYGIDLVNGYWKSEELWSKYGRIKRARLYHNDKPFRDLTFNDSRRWQRVTFPDIFVQAGDTMTLEVLEVFPGKGGGLAVTELALQGAH